MVPRGFPEPTETSFHQSLVYTPDFQKYRRTVPRADPRELQWEMDVSPTSCSRVISEEKRETTERKGTPAKPETLPSAWWRGTPAAPALGMMGQVDCKGQRGLHSKTLSQKETHSHQRAYDNSVRSLSQQHVKSNKGFMKRPWGSESLALVLVPSHAVMCH